MRIILRKNNTRQRIDKFLKKEVFLNSEITRGEIIRQIKNGNVLVNGKKIKPSYILKEGDAIEVRIKKQEVRSRKTIISNPKIKIEIIYEDKNIIVMNKPAGIQVHPDNKEKENTLVNALLAKFPEIKNVGEDPMRPGIVHRLDKDTSGVMVVARSQKSFKRLKNKFKNKEVEKKYLAIVFGKLDNSEGIINKPLAKASSYRKQVVAGKKTKTKIREAVTEYKVLKKFRGYSLVEVAPKTGRTHQIRVHLASIGHPVVGDKIYGKKIVRKNIIAGRPACNALHNNAGRQLLHAKSVKFELFGKKYFFESKLSNDFNRFLTKN